MASRVGSIGQHVLAAIAVWAMLCAAAVPAGARGDGIKAGPGRLHLGLDLDLVYETNANYAASDGAVGDLILRMRPGLTLDFPSDVVSFLLNGKVGYDYYFGIEESDTSDLSSVVGSADMTVGFNPNGVFAVFLEDQLSRTGDPRYTSLAGKFDRTDNEAKLRFQIRPTGGALQFDLAYGFFLDWFDDLEGMSSYGHRCYFSGKWRFFPKTALVIDFDADLRRYPNRYESGAHNPDINGIRSYVGLLGQITSSLSIVAKVGYGDTLLEGGTNLDGTPYAGGDFRSAVAQVEASLRFATTFLQLGYSRNFQPVINFGWFGTDKLYLRFQQQFLGKLNLGADFAFDMLAYGKPINSTATDREDYLLYGGASADYMILDWLSLGLAYQFQVLLTDWTDPTAVGSTELDYTKHAVIFRVVLDY
ncbi:MAG TPA: hypothetical protein PK668_19730 [Myxococcota bacterium]|nr:hypothetical protein [Myxococcota bacterium]HRY95036.1 hypothetical protein [Myxococcota bacterium]HSA21093.1 hypothetical protein [Myxococcota bacterium]